jgi:putative CocE/NonD family hydrolase
VSEATTGVPAGATLHTTLMVPMRDGVRLSMDLYFPAGPRHDLPVVLTRTPYDKRLFRAPGSEAWRFVAAGFVYAAQDLRGTFESEGACRVSENERADGFDTVTWLAAQCWSNGRIGTYGCSQRGEVQMQLAATRPPGLACMVAQAAASVMSGETSRSYIRMGGAVNLGVAAWYRTHMNTVRPQFPPGCDEALIRQASPFHPLKPVHEEMRLPQDLAHLPVIDILDRVGAPPSQWREFIEHLPCDPWWEGRGHVTRKDVFDVPILHVNSWFDFAVHETLVLADMVRSRGATPRCRNNQFVLISPAGHCGTEKLTPGARSGDLELGDPTLDWHGLYVQWFRHWLCGPRERVAGDFTAWPPVRYYLLGARRWREAGQWPPQTMRRTAWYLSSGRGANGLQGDGKLGAEVPQQDRADPFAYNPLDPVPTLGGVMWSPGDPPAVPAGAVDQRPVQRRRDVLVYTSAPFDVAQELAGPVEVELWVRSSARDTDFTAKLSIVQPDGRALWATEGILRLRWWQGLHAQCFVEPGAVVPIRIDMKATAWAIQPSARLRVEVSSSNFPRFERNLNTGGRNHDECHGIVARNEVLHGPQRPSALWLWMRPA